MEFYNKRVLTVSELTREIRAILEAKLFYVWVEGELSNFRISISGHCYFTIKDEHAQIKGVIFKSQRWGIGFKPQDGMHLICRGMVTVYAERGEYQLIIDHMEPKGVGARQLAFEQLKERLASEGLFDISRKRPLPILPRRIGVVTSPNGAAIRDILKILKRRFSNIGLLLYPVRVQGLESSIEIAGGINKLNEFSDIDVIIVGRGGGSREDLWAFNEEIVARSIFNSRVPVISAVGHETDTTLSDMVADMRVPTPSAAAEVVVKSKEEFINYLSGLVRRLKSGVKALLDERRIKLQGIEKGLVGPRRKLMVLRQGLDSLVDRMELSMSHLLSSARKDVSSIMYRLDGLSPLNVLSRGYSIARRLPSHRIIRDSNEVSLGDDVNIMLFKGGLYCKVYEKDKV